MPGRSKPCGARAASRAAQTRSGALSDAWSAVASDALFLATGDKLNFPRKGSNVKVSYCGKLANADGTYNKTKRTQVPLTVKAGVGKLIAGWDAALLEMSVGEKVVLTIPPEGAYGKKGMPPKIPPNATLIFEMELVAVMD